MDQDFYAQSVRVLLAYENEILSFRRVPLTDVGEVGAMTW